MRLENYPLYLFFCCLSTAMAQDGTLLLKSALTSVGSASVVLKDPNKTYLIQQSIGQQGIIGTATKGNISLQQGFLTHVLIENDLVPEGENINFTALPNPVSEVLTISFARRTRTPVQVRLFDLTGRLVFFREYAPDNAITVQVGSLEEAVYLLQITVDTYTWAKKIIRRNP